MRHAIGISHSPPLRVYGVRLMFARQHRCSRRAEKLFKFHSLNVNDIYIKFASRKKPHPAAGAHYSLPLGGGSTGARFPSLQQNKLLASRPSMSLLSSPFLKTFSSVQVFSVSGEASGSADPWRPGKWSEIGVFWKMSSQCDTILGNPKQTTLQATFRAITSALNVMRSAEKW